ncbi:MAG: ribosome-associated translation inhibitor RaiA [Victivallales bacterium]|jgi:putative sigma-54 modulation protein|nr:ribosome-associated translation inhibitor RaiA [Victivallales bacterium]MBT7163673.1 ribosome-associated translation inhibitor RaiA [Victivallales bacterium]MBT7304699.1 ribosome-associated translation inhibitor RaiA [Victivallales bacterium]
MEVIVSARHFELGDELRKHAETKVTELEVEHTKLTTARVVLEVQRNCHEAEVHLNGKHLDLVATSRTGDMYVSIDGAVDKLEKQLRRHLEKLQDHRVKEDAKFAAAEETAAGDDEEDLIEEEEVVQEV